MAGHKDSRDCKGTRAAVVVFNPLPLTLSHYERELATVVDVDGWLRFPGEGHASVFAKLRALLKYCRVARRLVRGPHHVLVLWPLIGLLDLLLWASVSVRLRGRATLVVHDPVPLRPQVGLGRPSQLAARIALRCVGSPDVICHTELAADALARMVPRARVNVVPHPLLEAEARTSTSSRTALVLGQFKAARDVELLPELGAALRREGFETHIKGRGWPQISHWQVEEGFLTEDRFDRAIRSAAVLVLPYQHYFQSGVALRAFESGTPVVARRHEFITGVFGEDYVGAVDSDGIEAWVTGCLLAEQLRDEDLLAAWSRTRAAWEAWQAGIGVVAR
jgi:glycosyltransferase involved in cell wall biosynthesis